MVATRGLTVYFDVVSPFGYLAYHVLRNDPIFSSTKITYIPILLGGVMKACGNTAPLHIKNKKEWINKERKRWAKTFNIPIHEQMPEGFPVNTLTVMRALCALTSLYEGREEEGQKKLLGLMDVLLKKFWIDHEGVYEKEVFGKVFEDVLGKEEAEKILTLIPTEGKKILVKNTDQAFADGAFGLPWIVATNRKQETEGFWGFDHLGQVCDFMGLERPRSGAWKSVL